MFNIIQLWTYVLCCLATLAGALIITLIPRLLIAPFKRRRMNQAPEEKMLVEPSIYTNVQNWAGDLISGNTTTGRILVVFAFVCSQAALIVYIWGKIKTSRKILDYCHISPTPMSETSRIDRPRLHEY